MKISFTIFLLFLEMISLKAQKLTPFEDYISKKWGLQDKNRKEVVSPKYDGIYGIGEARNLGNTKEMLEIVSDNKRGLIDEIAGKEIIPPKYDSIHRFVFGMATFRQNGKLEIVAPTYDTMKKR